MDMIRFNELYGWSQLFCSALIIFVSLVCLGIMIFAAGPCNEKFGAFQTYQMSGVLAIVGLVIFISWQNPIVPWFTYAIGYPAVFGFCYASLQAIGGALTDEAHSGAVMGLLGAAQTLAEGTSQLSSGFFYQLNPFLIYYVGIGCLVGIIVAAQFGKHFQAQLNAKLPLLGN